MIISFIVINPIVRKFPQNYFVIDCIKGLFINCIKGLFRSINLTRLLGFQDKIYIWWRFLNYLDVPFGS